MKIIRCTIDGIDAFFVNVEPDGTFLWSADINDANFFEEDADAEEVLLAMVTIQKFAKASVMEPKEVGYVWRMEVLPAISRLGKYFRGKVLTEEDEPEVAHKLKQYVEPIGLPDVYKQHIRLSVTEHQIEVMLPPDETIRRIRTLH